MQSSEVIQPNKSEEDMRAKLVETAQTTEAAVLISFTMGDDGITIQPKVNLFAVDMPRLFSAQGILQNTVRGRMEFIMLDYMRMMKEKADAAQETPDGEGQGDGAGPEPTGSV